jgi:hypothetical protein
MALICLHNGQVYGPQGLQGASAVVIDNGIITYVGDESGVSRFIFGNIDKIDVGGRIIFPGFIDTHLHLTEWARRREHLDLGSFISLKETCDFIREEAEDREWIIGGGWNQNAWKEQRFPHRKDLDFLGQEKKAVLFSKDLHSAWVNDGILNLFDFEDVLKMLHKGYVQRDADGRLTGLLHEEALEVLLDPLLRVRPTGIFREPESYFSDFYRLGITSVHTMEHFENYKKYLTLYQHSAQRGLRLGVYIYNSDSEEVYERGLRHGNGGDWLRFLGIKIFVDGALGSQTAWLRQPYENALHYGKKQMHGDELMRAIARAEGHACALSVHALGDAAVEHLLDILDQFGRPLRVPLRIEHAQLLDPELIRRIAEHSIPLSLNPAHIIDDKSIAELHWGDRSRYAYPFHSLKTAGIPFGFASDAPVESIHPWKGIYAAVQRTGKDDTEPWYPEESIRISDAVRAYSSQAALLSGWNEKKGLIMPGYLGDCFVCDRDVFEQDLEDWKNIHSVLTVIGGRIVHKEM